MSDNRRRSITPQVYGPALVATWWKVGYKELMAETMLVPAQCGR